MEFKHSHENLKKWYKSSKDAIKPSIVNIEWMGSESFESDKFRLLPYMVNKNGSNLYQILSNKYFISMIDFVKLKGESYQSIYICLSPSFHITKLVY